MKAHSFGVFGLFVFLVLGFPSLSLGAQTVEYPTVSSSYNTANNIVIIFYSC